MSEETPLGLTDNPRTLRRFTVTCLVCGRSATGTASRRYCSESCRQFAYYWRHSGQEAVSTSTKRRLRSVQAATGVGDAASSPRRPHVGTRVRVRLHEHGECEEAPHLPGEDGAVGRVVRDIPTARLQSHPCLVLFDRPVLCKLRGDIFPLTARHFAEDELEPL